MKNINKKINDKLQEKFKETPEEFYKRTWLAENRQSFNEYLKTHGLRQRSKASL